MVESADFLLLGVSIIPSGVESGVQYSDSEGLLQFSETVANAHKIPNQLCCNSNVVQVIMMGRLFTRASSLRYCGHPFANRTRIEYTELQFQSFVRPNSEPEDKERVGRRLTSKGYA
jgi:hypothetical protein